MSTEAWYKVWDRIKKHSPDFAKNELTGIESVLKWIDEHSGETGEVEELKRERDRLKRAMEVRDVRIETLALEGLRSERDKLKRMAELKDIRIETLTEDLRAAREDRDRYREQIGNLLNAIDAWKKKSGLY